MAGGLTVLPATGWGDSGVTATINPNGNVSWCCTTWHTPIPVNMGDAVGSLIVTVQDNGPAPTYIPGSQGDGGNNVTVKLIAQTSNGTAVLATKTTDGSGHTQSLTLTSNTPHVVVSGESLIVETTAVAIYPSIMSHPSLVGAIQVLPPGPTLAPFSANWRVRWNNGAPLVTVHSIQSSNLQIGLVPLSLRGAAEVYVAGGTPTDGTVLITASHGTGQDFTDRFSIGLQSPLGSGGTGNPLVNATSAQVAAAASATPPVSLAVGQPFLLGRIVSRFVTNIGTSNNTDASLEDAVIRATGNLTN